MPILEEYHNALRLGQKEVKAAAARGEETGLRILPGDPEELAMRRESLGVVEVPSELIVGTCNGLRRISFSPSFYPVLEADSEFAGKWIALCQAHLNEGIRDPIKAVEYLNRFYVVEGHKRVSVLKYFGAITIPAVVTRLLPRPSDKPEVAAYYEFLNFYQMTGLNFLVFKRPGEYRELLEAMGRPNREAWSAEEIYNFRSFYYMFRDACLRENTDPQYISLAFLVYIKLFGYQASRSKLSTQIAKELPMIRQEVLNRLENAGVALMLDDVVKKPLFTFPITEQLHAAFIHAGSSETSKWVYDHECGRYLLEDTMHDQVYTTSYENAVTDEAAEAAINEAVEKGAKLIFTTDPSLLLVSVKQAVRHPEVKFFNCSLNNSYPSVRTYYPRMYEAKFIKGAIAGTLSRSGWIGYVADYPTFGTIACINAFAQGARMVNANARILLSWDSLKEGGGIDSLRAKGIVYIDYLDRLAANAGPRSRELHNLALIQCDWGRFYQSLVRRVLDGSWKKESQGNRAITYWWGLNQKTVDVLCSRRLPAGTRRLAGVLRDAIQSERLDPFYGVLMNQQGHVVYGDNGPLPAHQILTMNWLSSYVEGSIPKPEELTDRARELIRVQGAEEACLG
ncbi:BMP family ABC transporter substrate-binding protein [uncultured Flavonifractor sp.]|uniref:BMP family ABC transporter substrate-binding protein n=1 Tax=uncultured Flavonifractor sp. TaxID=1193534 RepID=UPI0026372DB7|nr:BMP family ABC transporter substrate-binding protein [uncultured Flavonifractor sp.]